LATTVREISPGMRPGTRSLAIVATLGAGDGDDRETMLALPVLRRDRRVVLDWRGFPGKGTVVLVALQFGPAHLADPLPRIGHRESLPAVLWLVSDLCKLCWDGVQ
jgi:hypothetical protein